MNPWSLIFFRMYMIEHMCNACMELEIHICVHKGWRWDALVAKWRDIIAADRLSDMRMHTRSLWFMNVGVDDVCVCVWYHTYHMCEWVVCCFCIDRVKVRRWLPYQSFEVVPGDHRSEIATRSRTNFFFVVIRDQQSLLLMLLRIAYIFSYCCFFCCFFFYFLLNTKQKI